MNVNEWISQSINQINYRDFRSLEYRQQESKDLLQYQLICRKLPHQLPEESVRHRNLYMVSHPTIPALLFYLEASLPKLHLSRTLVKHQCRLLSRLSKIKGSDDYDLRRIRWWWCKNGNIAVRYFFSAVVLLKKSKSFFFLFTSGMTL